MADLPYTYTDDDGDRLHINHPINHPGISFIAGSDVLSMEPPTGEDAVALARAILAAAGNTGHLVVSEDDRDESRRYIRILEAQRADLRADLREVRAQSDRVAAVEQRLAASRVSEGDMVEPGDEVPDQALRAARALPALTKRVTQIEEHLGITPESA